jgi:hypothetical protein
MAAAELMLSGCTTASDRHSIFPNDCTLDRQIQAAHAIGIWFYASRGSLSKSISQGGLAPASTPDAHSAFSGTVSSQSATAALCESRCVNKFVRLAVETDSVQRCASEFRELRNLIMDTRLFLQTKLLAIAN